MDNRTIRQAIMKRCPEVYFIARPIKQHGKVIISMLARIPGQKRPTQIFSDMPDTALISHRELLSTLISEVSDEIKKIKSGEKTPPDNPLESWPTLSLEGQKVFDTEGIQYMGPLSESVHGPQSAK